MGISEFREVPAEEQQIEGLLCLAERQETKWVFTNLVRYLRKNSK